MDHINEVCRQTVNLIYRTCTFILCVPQKIRQRKESRQQPVQYSGVKKMNRHELEIERSLLRHAQRSDDLSYLVVPGNESSLMGTLCDMVFLGGSREDLAYPKSYVHL